MYNVMMKQRFGRDALELVQTSNGFDVTYVTEEKNFDGDELYGPGAPEFVYYTNNTRSFKKGEFLAARSYFVERAASDNPFKD